MGVCETLMPDVVAPEVHQNDRSHVRELSGPTFDSIQYGGWLHEGPKKNTKLSKLGGWAFAWDNTVYACS